MPDDRLIVALDVPNALEGLQLAERLGDAVSFYKIGLGMLTGGGLALADEGEGRGADQVGILRVGGKEHLRGGIGKHCLYDRLHAFHLAHHG